MQAVINLNSAEPPPSAGALAPGPLFDEHRQAPEPKNTTRGLELLLEHLLTPGVFGSAVRFDWHLGDRDFLADNLVGLVRLARRALEGAPLAFVFDRARRPVSLAEGLDRQHQAVLLMVGLHLPRLIQHCGTPLDPPLFLNKLGSLARLALSAALQKRDYLRRRRGDRSALQRGFVVDRARLIVVPVGLESATQTLLGRGISSGGAAREFAQQVVGRLQTVLEKDAQAYALETGVDSALGHRLQPAGRGPEEPPDSRHLWPISDGRWPSPEELAGLTPSDPRAAAKDQLQGASPLHKAAGAGTVALLVSEQRPLSAEELVRLLRFAWQQTEVTRVRLVRQVPQPRQLTAPWASTEALA